MALTIVLVIFVQKFFYPCLKNLRPKNHFLAILIIGANTSKMVEDGVHQTEGVQIS